MKRAGLTVGYSTEYVCHPRVGPSPAGRNWEAGIPAAWRWANARSSLALSAPAVLATFGPGSAGGADDGSRFGVAGLPLKFHAGPTAGREVWERRESQDTCRISPSPKGSAIISPLGPRECGTFHPQNECGAFPGSGERAREKHSGAPLRNIPCAPHPSTPWAIYCWESEGQKGYTSSQRTGRPR